MSYFKFNVCPGDIEENIWSYEGALTKLSSEYNPTEYTQSGPHARRMLEERAKMTDQEYIENYKRFFKAE